tara:strand:+ start:196 stop:525 length:330 start_codon:yes stop_codon:yes gene_type:complete
MVFSRARSSAVRKENQMNYIVTTTWSHPAEMNKEKLADLQKQYADIPEVLNIYWFEVDPKTHGSVVVYKDKASHEAKLASATLNRARSNQLGMKMTHEARGESFAILRD